MTCRGTPSNRPIGSATTVKITRVEAIPLAATFEQIYGGLDRVPHHMLYPSANFANVGAPRTGQYTCLVRIGTDEGLVGVGEAYGLRDPRVSAAIVEHVLAPVLIGRDPLWCYASPVTLCDPDTAQECARELLAKGFGAVKVKVGGTLAND